MVGPREFRVRRCIFTKLGGAQNLGESTFSMLQRVADKIKQYRAHGIHIFPDWSARKWYKDFMSFKRTELFFPMGTKLFELEGKTCKGTKWPTKAIVFCVCAHKCHMLNPETQVVHRDPRKPRISSYVIYHPPRNLDSLQSEWGDQFSLDGLRKVSTNKGRERIPPPGEGSDVRPSPLTKRQEGGSQKGLLSNEAPRGGSGNPIAHPKTHN